MPVRNTSITSSPRSQCSSKHISPNAKLKSPGPQRTLRRSRRNGSNSQIKITSMFPSKRNRSPDKDEVHHSKKVKTAGEDNDLDADKSVDSSISETSIKAESLEDQKSKDNDLTMLENNSLSENKSTNDNTDNNKNTNSKNGIEIETDIKDSKHEMNMDTASIPYSNNPNNEKCVICGQFLNNSDIIYYQGHPQNAVEEYIALTSEKLVLSSGDEGDIMERPQANITGFSIFDQHGHLCPIDGGLVENDVRIYMSGYLKSICCDSTDIDEECIAAKDIGPIIEWFIHGFDGGDKNCITLSTEFAEYNLQLPSDQYKPLMDNLYEKIWISKVVVEYLEEYDYLQPTYEDLLQNIRGHTIPELNDKEMTEEMLHKHAHFVCDQVVSLEADEDEEPLITLPCMRELIKLMGIKFGKRRSTKITYKKVDKKAGPRPPPHP